MRLRRSRKIWRVHEGHDFEASSQFQAAERQTEPTKPHRHAEPVFYRLCGAREITTIKFQQVIPILKRFKQPPPYAQCQEHG
ncbi:MAG: hypothetical protein DMG85_10945 [Acidobacteria bacterium]|nr:MAG: hypothetical protein DMG85_10945 [Acidobacteriota bacterium]